MARLSEEKINEVRQSVDIVDVIGSYISVSKQGRSYKSICPFHEDTHPSMSISQTKQIFNCFVCGAKGNVFQFLQKYLNISYIEAVKKVSEIGHVDLGNFEDHSFKRQIPESMKVLYDIHEEAQKIFRYYLRTQTGLEAYHYLKNRGIDDAVMDYFGIGFAPDRVLYDALKKLNYAHIDMVRSGLIIEAGSQYYDRFKQRIMFPLHDYQGQVIGFSGRVYENHQNEAKYINSPESDIFVKGELLYNLSRARQAIKQENKLYLVEGFMDVIALYRAGIKNVVALMGTALTASHARMLLRLTQHVTIMLDGDGPGCKAALKCSEILKKSSFDITFIKLPEGLDPDEILQQKGKEALLSLMNQEIKELAFKMDVYHTSFNMDNFEDRKQYVEKIIDDIAQLDNTMDFDYYCQMLAQKSQFSIEVIQNEALKRKGKKDVIVKQPRTISYPQAKQMIHRYEKAERDLLHYMMMDRDIAYVYEKKAGFMYSKVYKILASYIVDYYRQHQHLNIADFIDFLNDERLLQLSIDIYDMSLPSLENQKAIDDYIRNIKEHALSLEIEDLKRQYQEESDFEKKIEYMKKMTDLRKEVSKGHEKENKHAGDI